MNEDTSYQGWTNHATWVVGLWAGNDEAVYRLTEMCKPFTAQSAKEFYRDVIPSSMKMSIAKDMWKGESIRDVDWQEIAESWSEE